MIYISGQITNNPNYIKDFEDAEKFLRIACGGCVNPVKLKHSETATWSDFMRGDIKALCECDSIFMLRNWKKSKGARLEYKIAKALGLSVIFQKKLQKQKRGKTLWV